MSILRRIGVYRKSRLTRLLYTDQEVNQALDVSYRSGSPHLVYLDPQTDELNIISSALQEVRMRRSGCDTYISVKCGDPSEPKIVNIQTQDRGLVRKLKQVETQLTS